MDVQGEPVNSMKSHARRKHDLSSWFQHLIELLPQGRSNGFQPPRPNGSTELRQLVSIPFLHEIQVHMPALRIPLTDLCTDPKERPFGLLFKHVAHRLGDLAQRKNLALRTSG